MKVLNTRMIILLYSVGYYVLETFKRRMVIIMIGRDGYDKDISNIYIEQSSNLDNKMNK